MISFFKNIKLLTFYLIHIIIQIIVPRSIEISTELARKKSLCTSEETIFQNETIKYE